MSNGGWGFTEENNTPIQPMNNNGTPTPYPPQNISGGTLKKPQKWKILIPITLAVVLTLISIFIGFRISTNFKNTSDEASLPLRTIPTTSADAGAPTSESSTAVTATVTKKVKAPETTTTRATTKTSSKNTATSSESPTRTTITQSAAPSSSSLACDGRGVLIIDSIDDNGNQITSGGGTGPHSDAPNEPGAQVLPPGMCNSLRSELNGTAIHAVVIDYGSDTDSLCAAASSNRIPRILTNNSGPYDSSPC